MTYAWVTRRGDVIREQLLCPAASGRCLAVVDRPAERDAQATVVIAHGLTGDRVGPAELLSRLSASLCRELGVRVVRFDFSGAADSSGAFEALTFAGMTEEFTELAVRHCEPGRPVICSGLSIGGVPATLASVRLRERFGIGVAGIVLMSSDLIEGVRFGATGPTAIRGGEFHLPEAFFREREKLSPRTVLGAAGFPLLFIYGAEDAKVGAEAGWFSARGQVVAIEGDHLFQSARARRGLLDAWTRFVHETTLPGSEAL